MTLLRWLILSFLEGKNKRCGILTNQNSVLEHGPLPLDDPGLVIRSKFQSSSRSLNVMSKITIVSSFHRRFILLLLALLLVFCIRKDCSVLASYPFNRITIAETLLEARNRYYKSYSTPAPQSSHETLLKAIRANDGFPNSVYELTCEGSKFSCLFEDLYDDTNTVESDKFAKHVSRAIEIWMSILASPRRKDLIHFVSLNGKLSKIAKMAFALLYLHIDSQKRFKEMETESVKLLRNLGALPPSHIKEQQLNAPSRFEPIMSSPFYFWTDFPILREFDMKSLIILSGEQFYRIYVIGFLAKVSKELVSQGKCTPDALDINNAHRAGTGIHSHDILLSVEAEDSYSRPQNESSNIKQKHQRFIDEAKMQIICNQNLCSLYETLSSRLRTERILASIAFSMLVALLVYLSIFFPPAKNAYFDDENDPERQRRSSLEFEAVTDEDDLGNHIHDSIPELP